MATAVVGVLGDLLGGLLGGHAARAQGATNENLAVNELVKGYDEGMRTIFKMANSGQMTANDAINAVQSLMQQYWQALARFQNAPGSHGAPCANKPVGSPPSQVGDSTKCDKNCTAGCCVGCNPLNAGASNAIYVFQNGGGRAEFPQKNGSPKYGGEERAGYSLEYIPPKGPVGEFGNLLDELTSSLTGQPGMPGGLGSGSNTSVMVLVIGFAILLLIVMVVRR